MWSEHFIIIRWTVATRFNEDVWRTGTIQCATTEMPNRVSRRATNRSEPSTGQICAEQALEIMQRLVQAIPSPSIHPSIPTSLLLLPLRTYIMRVERE